MSATTSSQQEVDFLRGQTGTLSQTSIWTSANPPKFTGAFGILLQDLEAGQSLIRAFIRLHEASEASRTNAAAILTLVQRYKTRITVPPKKTG